METGAAKDGRYHATYSDSEELIPAATSRDERTRSRGRRLSASGGRSTRHSAQLSPRASAVSRTTNEASGQLRPWTRADTALSKALSQVLRHRSALRLDGAGFAGIQEVLDNPRIRSHQPTVAWLNYIIKANDKRRFALDETGTRVRAVQGHSVPIDSSQLLRQLALGDFGSLVPAHALHSTYYVHIPSIMQHGLLPGGRKGERFRRHIHLAMSRNPTAGLRSGSEVILEIDLARAHNSGCTFFVSENDVLLTEDVIPPPCIVHATRTDNGAVYELRKFRSAYKRVCAASSLHLPADMCHNSLTTIAAISAQHMMPLFGRFTSRSRRELSSPTGLKTSRQRWAVSPWTPLGRAPDLPAEHLLPYALDAGLPWNLFGLRIVMQSGTPVGQERRYSWNPTAGRSVASTPPTRDTPSPSEDHTESSAHPLEISYDYSDAATVKTRRTGMQTRIAGRPRPTVAPRLLEEANKQGMPGYAARSPNGPASSSAGNVLDGLAAPLPIKRKTAYYADDSFSESSPDSTGADATCYREAEASCQDAKWYEATSPCRPEGHTCTSAILCPTQDTDAPAGSTARSEDPVESAIDFGFVVQVGSGLESRAAGDGGQGKPRAAAKSLVRSGLRCHQCFLKSWICLCDRAPVEIDRRDTAPGTFGSYGLLYLLCMHPPVPLCPAVSDYSHDTYTGMPTPWQHQRREAASARLTATPLCNSLVGEPVIAPFSAFTKWQHMHRPFNLRSLYDPRCDKRCRARSPWSAPGPYKLQESSRYRLHKGPWVPPPVVTVPTVFAASELPNFAPCRTQRCFPCTAIPPWRLAYGADEPTRGPKSAPLHILTAPHLEYLGKRGVRVSPLSAGGEGPTQSHLWIHTEPGKLAEGSQHLTTCYNGSSYAQTTTAFCSCPAQGYRPWGRLFHRFRFRYLLSLRRRRRHSARPSLSLTVHTAAAPSAPARSAKLGQLAAARPGAGRALLFSLLYFFLIEGVSGSPHPTTQRLAATASVARKRAWIRVNRQAAAGRPAWYRHLLITEPQIQLTTAGLDSRAPRPTLSCRRGGVSRLNVLSLNVGSLSGFLWAEIKAYIASPKCDADFILLQEVHWQQTCSFRVGGWAAFVSATAERADGVMILAHPRYQDSQLKFDEVVRGRVLRVQVSLQQSKVELFSVYQRVWQNQLTKSDNVEQRQSVLNKLAAQVRSIARRSTVIVAGDFNAEVVPTPGRIGHCVPRTPRHVGPDSPDPMALTRFVEETELVVLNTWCLRDPLTFRSATGSSQIDYVMVRAPSADHRARQSFPAEPPVGSWRSMGHRSIHASVRLVKHYHIQGPKRVRPTLNTKDLQEQARTGGADIDRLRSEVRSELAAMPSQDPDEALQTLNSIVLKAAIRAFPRQAAPKSSQPVDFVPLWQLRSSLRKHWRRDLQGLFEAWRLSQLHGKTAAAARRTHVEAKRAYTRQLLGEAQQAQEAHLPHRVYQLVNRLKPWQPRTRPRLKSKQGELLSREGELELLRNYCHEVFAPQVPVPSAGGLAFHTDAGTWARLLGQTGFNKAVPTGHAPSAAWRACADVLGDALSRISKSATCLQRMPHSWSSPELIWLPKPLKVPDDPSRLRPIGLLTPIAKAAAASIRGLLMDGILASLQDIPQFAYLPGRDLNDALARVNHRMEVIRTSLRFSTTNRFDQRTIRENTRQGGRWLHPVCGGAVLSIDLHKAFDMVSRKQLANTLAALPGPAEAKAAALRLHTECTYHLRVAGQGAAVHTTRGVRQGCRLAPALWSAVTGDLLRRMTEDPRRGPYTVFADDHLGSWVFHTLEDMRRMDSEVTALLTVLTEAGMDISPSKSKLILKVKGRQPSSTPVPGKSKRMELGIGASAQGSIPSSFPSRTRSPTWALSSPLASRLTALWSTGSRRHDGANANSSVASEAARS